MAEPATGDERPRRFERLSFTPRASLTIRILTVNIIALALLAGSFFYLDNYRRDLLDERFSLARSEAQIVAEALLGVRRDKMDRLMVQIAEEQHLRLRLYRPDGSLVKDSFRLARPTFSLIDPKTEPWYMDAARMIDEAMDFILGADPVPNYVEYALPDASAWPELAIGRRLGYTQVFLRYAPDRTPVITAAAPVGHDGTMLLTTRNARDITLSVRDARQTLAIIVAAAVLISVQLSLYLARTIVQPLRTLVRAAVRVRLGRDREVVVPRLPERRDEIGMLARAISDMTAALRHRIDGVESFAADVAHEIKNPLASLRSALESMAKVDEPELRRQLTDIAVHDVQRIDRLISEIADASRIDAELSRATFEPVDLAALIDSAVGARAHRPDSAGTAIKVRRKGRGPFAVMGVPARLERVIENLLDNAVSFSPPGGEIAITLRTQEDAVEAEIRDQGPGISASEREKVFERFHSVRPEAESFGAHSGLGLAIARTIVEAHDGTLTLHDPPKGTGACFVIALPVPIEAK
ncbi:MAG: ATP-binding protein [Candidatus Andeanibacterium colombiense]|uniref:histidine kinase n=1 Tax=Candidatus Andeanibacterium colombiense TaxID=3121345 RepID=A0AAJ6BQP1_9SPHN|nr:MAG: ATP-binding protein [Sphingomonadaceae bacterium]